MKKALDKEYEASLKSIETENRIDRLFYRPIGFRIAKVLRNTPVTPNMVTIISIFFGVAAGPLFYYNNIVLSVCGIICLIIANILDCVDGQLARLSGIKSKIGRILDGLAGDLWFLSIYVFLAMRLNNEFNTWMFFIPASLAGLSHIIQANITDYYKTLHLYFLDTEKGYEFQRSTEVRKQHKEMKPGIEKALFFFYVGYTSLQEVLTPKQQLFFEKLDKYYEDRTPDYVRSFVTIKSRIVMKKYLDYMTFNGRSIILFLAVLSGYVWVYFAYEIIVLNIFLIISVYKYERIFAWFYDPKIKKTDPADPLIERV